MRAMIDKTCTVCHTSFSIRVSDVNRGRGRYCSKSCSSSGSNNPAYRHGDSARKRQSKEYRTWAGIKQRTSNSHRPNSDYYVNRGIKMCERWKNSFENFLEDMGRAPSSGHSIDRINNDGDYEPDNCKWATHNEQMSNTRWNKPIEYNGERLTQEEWGRKTGIGGTNICKRLKRGWSIERALTTPV